MAPSGINGPRSSPKNPSSARPNGRVRSQAGRLIRLAECEHRLCRAFTIRGCILPGSPIAFERNGVAPICKQRPECCDESERLVEGEMVMSLGYLDHR